MKKCLKVSCQVCIFKAGKCLAAFEPHLCSLTSSEVRIEFWKHLIYISNIFHILLGKTLFVSFIMDKGINAEKLLCVKPCTCVCPYENQTPLFISHVFKSFTSQFMFTQHPMCCWHLFANECVKVNCDIKRGGAKYVEYMHVVFCSLKCELYTRCTR